VFLGFVIPILGFLAPVLFWAIKRRDSEFLARQGREAGNLALTSLGATFVLGALASAGVIYFQLNAKSSEGGADTLFLMVGAGLFYLLFAVINLRWWIVSIMAAVKASAGEQVTHAAIIRFLK
jgi:uncharacterized Tic20 family protein